MILFILMNLIVGLSAFLLTYRIFRFSNFTDSLLSVFILYFAQITITELALGIIGTLYLTNLILLNAGILFLVWFICRKRQPFFSPFGIRKALGEVLNNKVILLALAVIFAFGITKVFINLVNPPFGWDCLNYHFTFPVEWMKQGNLHNPIVVSDDPFPTYYPINGSLFFLWLMFPLKNACLADLGQLPFFIISFISIYGICRKLNLARECSFLASCSFVFIPNFFKQLQIAYIDMMVAGVFLAAVNFLLSVSEGPNLKNVFMFSLSCGSLIGLKTTALPYSLFILLPFFYLIFSDKRISPKSKWTYIGLLFLIIFIFGSFSYLRNFTLTGNPFYPLIVTIKDKILFHGVIDKVTFTARNIEAEYSLSKLLFHEGLGIQTLLLVLSAVIFALPLNIFINKKRNLFSNYLMILPLLLYLAYRFILPIPNSRYLYPMLGAGIIAGFYILYSLKIPTKILGVIVFIFIIASAFESARGIELAFSLGLVPILFVLSLFILRHKNIRNVLFSRRALILVIALAFFILKLAILDYRKNEYVRYVKYSRYWPDATSAWLWLNKNTTGNNIAYVGRPVPFPLYGTDFKNNVYYVSVNATDPIFLHSLKKSRYSWQDAEGMHKSFAEQNNYRGNADYLTWRNHLKKRKTDFFFIYSLHHTKDIIFPLEEEWAKAHPEEFKLEFSNETTRIYKLKP